MQILLILLPILLPATLLLAGGFVCVAACTAPQMTIDTTPVPSLDVKRYMGTWYEIARYENTFEKGLEQVQARYTMLPNGRVEVINSGFDPVTQRRREAVGKAKTSDKPGRLRVSFFWIFYSDYNVLALGRDYEWALVGSSSPRYLWILSRTPTLSSATLENILHIARTKGYDTGKLYFTPPSRESPAPRRE